MGKDSIRLGLIGSEVQVATKSETLRRMREFRHTVTAESMKEALLPSGHSATDAFDAVIVGSYEDALSAAQCGKHVYLDAPYSRSLQETEALLEISRKAGVRVALGGLPRYSPACRVIFDRFQAGKLGLPGLLRVHRWSARSDQPIWPAVFGDIDLALQLFQVRPNAIYAVGNSDHAYFQVHLGFPGGGMGLLDFARGLPAGPNYNSLSLIGSRGAAYADDHHNTHLLFNGESPVALLSDVEKGEAASLRAFVHRIAGGSTPPNFDEEEAFLTAHRVTDAVRRSLDSKEALQLRGEEYGPA